jgi:hypothetical protein
VGQLVWGEWLLQEGVVTARDTSPHHFVPRIAGHEQYLGMISVRAGALYQIEARSSRHDEVGDQQLDVVVLIEFLQSFRRVAGFDDNVALAFQRSGGRSGRIRSGVQDTFRAGGTCRTPA